MTFLRWPVAGALALLIAMSACVRGGAEEVRGLRASLDDGRYRLSWAQADARYVRVVRLDREGRVVGVDPQGPVERRWMPGRHAFSMPTTDLPDLVVLHLARTPQLAAEGADFVIAR